MQSIISSVKQMYEAFPYPHYPLFVPIRWQEGYMGQSAVSTRLNASAPPQLHAMPRHILIAGSGDIQPYILRHLEPWFHHLDCVDFSSKSLERARLRLGIHSRNTTFKVDDIDAFLSRSLSTYDHIECYGVLHHLSSPAKTLNLMRQHLKAAGTIRLMVYNQRSRQWIHHLQRAFALLSINPYRNSDLTWTKKFLSAFAENSSVMKERLAAMGSPILRNDTRFVDTFLHRREAKIKIKRWFEMFTAAGLEPYALYDRFGELDDLSNPLWHMPSPEQLVERSEDGRFENNLEIFLRIKSPHSHSTSTNLSTVPQFRAKTLFLKSPPKAWFDYPETQGTPFLARWHFWTAYLQHLKSPDQGKLSDTWLSNQPITRLQRLGRLGAIFPRQLPGKNWQLQVAAPLHEVMDPLELPVPTPWWNHPNSIELLIQARLDQMSTNTLQRFNMIIKRLRAAEFY